MSREAAVADKTKWVVWACLEKGRRLSVEETCLESSYAPGAEGRKTSKDHFKIPLPHYLIGERSIICSL